METKYTDLNDMTHGCFYTGNAQNISNSPTAIVSSSESQMAVLAISASFYGRGFQLALTRLGIAVRYNGGTWQNWNIIPFT